MKKYILNVTEGDIGLRADVFVSKLLEDITRSQIKKVFDKKDVLIENMPIKPSYLVKFDDEISISIETDLNLNIDPINLNLEFLYEDEDVAVVYKPQGLVVHPAVSFKDVTLVNGLKYQVKQLSDLNGDLRPGIVHRIDKDTSGLLLVAKTNEAHESLVLQLQKKTVKRVYEAICLHPFEEDTGTIKTPIGRDETNRLKMAVTDDGKLAVTHFSVKKRNQDYSLIECVLETGRTHQIRVHMQYIGHPILGDPVYGKKPIYGNTGQFLHAKTIGFVHPTTNKYLEFTKEAPITFLDTLEKLGLK
ncbi:MAG: RluA family pseudouridine synthase [Acholeplasma sp.]|nr:RluA family pseudouridine synthase [Acholeplasma sp.]